VPPPNPGDPELRDLDIQGNRTVASSLIRARIVTTETSWVPFSETQYYDEVALEEDLKRIVRLYQAEGFYKAKIVSHEVTPAGKDRVDAVVHIDEGPPTRVRALLVQGLDELPANVRAVALEELPLAEGKTLREESFEALKSELSERLRDFGYAEARSHGQAQVDLDADCADVTVDVEPGQRYRIGELLVTGAEQIPRERIESEARVALPRDELFSDKALVEAQRRLFDLGVFSVVRVKLGTPDREARVVSITVEVHESPFRTLRLGGGLYLDTRRTELPRLTLEWTHRNFLGGMRRLTAKLEPSLVLLPSLPAIVSGEKPSVDVGLVTSLRFEQPEVIGSDTAFVATVGFERGVDPSFNYNAVSGRLGLLFRYRRIFTLEPSYNLSLFKLSGAAPTAMSYAPPSQAAVLDACAARNDLCRLAFLEVRAALDLRDNPVEPTRGAWLAASVQGGSTYLGGTYDYIRLLPDVRGYIPLGPHVLALRATAGFLWPTGTEASSVLSRFFLGGADSERGFGYRQLAPSLVTCQYRDSKTGQCQNAAQAGVSPSNLTEVLPVGGNAMLAASAEVRFTLPANFGVVVFVDTGEVTPSIADLSLLSLNVAVGLGLRYRTPFGPLRVDVAYRVNDPRPDPAISYPVNLALSSDLPPGAVLSSISRVALQISVGEAF
jgi:translocation and assembly module TamA